jgi:hypothetical protein
MPISAPDAPMSGATVFTPLPREALFDPGAVFPAHELTLRVLSLFWRDCCCPPYRSRAPAPVVQFAGAGDTVAPRAQRAWWLTNEGIVREPGGPQAGALRPFLGGESAEEEADRRWPRYEFQVFARPFEVEMRFHRGGRVVQGHRTRLFAQLDCRVRVLEREPWWLR